MYIRKHKLDMKCPNCNSAELSKVKVSATFVEAKSTKEQKIENGIGYYCAKCGCLVAMEPKVEEPTTPDVRKRVKYGIKKQADLNKYSAMKQEATAKLAELKKELARLEKIVDNGKPKDKAVKEAAKQLDKVNDQIAKYVEQLNTATANLPKYKK